LQLEAANDEGDDDQVEAAREALLASLNAQRELNGEEALTELPEETSENVEEEEVRENIQEALTALEEAASELAAAQAQTVAEDLQQELQTRDAKIHSLVEENKLTIIELQNSVNRFKLFEEKLNNEMKTLMDQKTNEDNSFNKELIQAQNQRDHL
jgi:hypothetical protein